MAVGTKGTKKPAGNISGKQDHILVGFDKDVTPKLLPIPSVSDSKKELEKIEPAQPLRSVGREAFISIMYMHEIGLTVDQISDEIQVDRDKIVKVISEGKSLVGDGILQKIDNAIPSLARYISDNEIKRKAVKNYLFGIIVGGFPSQFEKDRDSKKSQKISYIQRQLRKGYDNLKEVKAEDIVENSTQARKEHDTRSYKYDNEAEIPPENLSENKSENLGEALSAIFDRAEEISSDAVRGTPARDSGYQKKVRSNVGFEPEIVEWLKSKAKSDQHFSHVNSILRALMEAESTPSSEM